MQVDLDELAAVHVGVGLDRAHERRHALRGLLPARPPAAPRSASPRPSAGPLRSLRRRARATRIEPLLDRRPRPPAARPAARAPRSPVSSSRASSSSSASAASSASSAVAAVPRAKASCCSATSFSASVRSTPASTKCASAELITSSASVSCAAALRAAAAGLFSSCARPAAIVPSEDRRSRLCSHLGDPAHHRCDLSHHAAVDRRLRERQPAEVLGGDHRHPAGGLRLHARPERAAGERRRSRPSRSARVAADRLGAPLIDEQRLAPRPRAAAASPLGASPCSAISSPRLDVVGPRASGDPLGELRIVELVEQVDAAQLLERDRSLVTGASLTTRGGIRGSATPPSSPRPRRWQPA